MTSYIERRLREMADQQMYCFCKDDLRKAADEIAALKRENERLRTAYFKMNNDICQTLGKALGYPWIKDDKKNFPDATEADGVCIGDHVAESLADEAGEKIARLKAQLARAKEALRWYADSGKPGEFKIVDADNDFISDMSTWGSRAAAILAELER